MEQVLCQAGRTKIRGLPGLTGRQNLPSGTDDLVGAMDMVEGVKAGRVGGPAPFARDDTRTAEELFSVEGPVTSMTQNARLSAVPGIGVESMLALQAVDEKAERERAARKRGTAMIAALTDLQRAMLAREDPAAALRDLNELAGAVPSSDDPALGAILRAITLRSRVEIARRDRRGG
jgi:hypothetical protein